MEPFAHISKNVVIGRDDFLFLYNGGHYVHDYHTRARRPSPESVGAVWINIESRRNYCFINDIEYRHIIFPNKQTVLADFYPTDLTSVTDQFLLGQDVREDILDMYPLLESLGHDAWLKTDTHLNDKGLILSAIGIAESLLKEDLQHHTSSLLKKSFVRQRRGDLAIMLGEAGASLCEEEVLYHPFWIQHQFTNSLPGGNNGLIDILINKNATNDSRLLIYGDSFGRGCVSCLSYFFSHVMFCRSPFFHDEIASLYRPSYILTQSIERYLPSTMLDSERPFFLFYTVLGKHGKAFEGDKVFFEALNGELSYPRKPYHLFMDSLPEKGQYEH
jgi:hypothetical protein